MEKVQRSFPLLPMFYCLLHLLLRMNANLLKMSWLVMQKTTFALFLSMQLSLNCDTASKWSNIYGAGVHMTPRQEGRKTKDLRYFLFLQ